MHAADETEVSGRPADGDDGPTAPRRARPRRRLDRRTVGVSVAVATVAALAAGLLASVALDGDDGSDAAGVDTIDLVQPVDAARLAAVPLVAPDGSGTTLGDHLDGTPVVLNFWQRSCAPCVTEMPLLEQAARDNPDLAVLGVNTQESVDDARAVVEQTAITYPWLRDPDGDLFYEAQGAGMPTTIALDGDGEVITSRTGAFADQAELQAWIDRYLG